MCHHGPMRTVPILGLVLCGSLWTLPLECQTPASEPLASDPVSAAAGAYDLLCSYSARVDAPDRSQNDIDYDWDHYERCARVSLDGRMSLESSHLDRLSFSEGLASVAVSSLGWFYVRPDGETLSVVNYDNGPDPWSEDLTRGFRNGQVVYLTRSFEEATGHRYDWAWPFENGRALVCQGCSVEESEFEHKNLAGGRWWFIDPAGNEVDREGLTDEENSRLEKSAADGAGRFR